jgi:ribosome-associated protein
MNPKRGGSMKTNIEINTDSIKLDQFLKWAGIVDSGGEAKSLIQNGTVMVNGVVENRRGRSLHPGDSITVAAGEYIVIGTRGV